jgi:hypothetical protein
MAAIMDRDYITPIYKQANPEDIFHSYVDITKADRILGFKFHDVLSCLETVIRPIRSLAINSNQTSSI